MLGLLSTVLSLSSVVCALSVTPRQSAASQTVVDLGSAGVWQGALQNNNTVVAFRGIPYAAPPVGPLRFMPPVALAPQNSSVQSAVNNASRCVQFSTTSYVGWNAGPGVEDCLYAWIWKPAGAKAGDNLPVMVYTHGGGYQNSFAANNDFSDWVSQDQKFIAVSANYRLGLFGFVGSAELKNQGIPDNAGLLDSRFATEWTKKNIAQFGGDPDKITIMGQSGGGGNIAQQLLLFDGTGYSFRAAVPRSIQRSPVYTPDFLQPRNDALAKLVNCTTGAGQLACLRTVDAQTLRVAANNVTTKYSQFLPVVDGQSLTDTTANLFRNGKVAKVPTLSGFVTGESGGFISSSDGNITAQVLSNLPTADSHVVSVANTIYPPANANISSYATGTYPNNVTRARIVFAEILAQSSSEMVARGTAGTGQAAYTFRFDAPQPGYTIDQGTTHSSDNFYLQNTTASFNVTQQAVAFEWRAYVGSFIKHLDPNVEKLEKSPYWYQHGNNFQSDGSIFAPRMVVGFKLNSTAAPDIPTGSVMEIANKAEQDRVHFWLSANATASTFQ